MKKTKLFTSIAALALVLGLGACTEVSEETTSEEESTPSESETTTETTDTSESTPTTPSEDPDGYVLVGDFVDSNWDAKVESSSRYYIPKGTTHFELSVEIAKAPDFGEYDPWTAGLRVVEWGDSWNLVAGFDELDPDSIGDFQEGGDKNIAVDWGATYKIVLDLGETNSIKLTIDEEAVKLTEGAYRLGAADIGSGSNGIAYRYFLTIDNGAKTSTRWNLGADVYVDANTEGEGYALKYVEGEETLYIGYNGSGTALVSKSEPYYWAYDSENGVFVDTIEETVVDEKDADGNATSYKASGRFIGMQEGYEYLRAYATSNLTSDNYYGATLFSEYPGILEAPVVEEPEVNLELATSLTSGGEYYLAYAATDEYYCFNGQKVGSNDWYLGATTSIESAVKVTVTGDNTNGWTIAFDGKTFEGWENNGHGELTYFEGESTHNGVTTFNWNSEYNTVTTTIGSNTYYIEYQLYNGTHEIGLNGMSYIQSTGQVVQFFTLAA